MANGVCPLPFRSGPKPFRIRSGSVWDLFRIRYIPGKDPGLNPSGFLGRVLNRSTVFLNLHKLQTRAPTTCAGHDYSWPTQEIPGRHKERCLRLRKRGNFKNHARGALNQSVDAESFAPQALFLKWCMLERTQFSM